jgi:hypothetical protein
MREYIAPTLFLLLLSSLHGQTVPTGWQTVTDSKKACQVAVPADWSPYGDNVGAAVFQEVSTAIVTVTSQPAQDFTPLSESMQKLLEIPKEKMFENSPKRIFYQEQISKNKEDPNGYSFSVPGKTGTCSGHVRALPGISEEVIRKIALSLGPAAGARSPNL